MRKELSNVRNLLFDFGGILVDLDREQCRAAFSAIGVDASRMIGDYLQSGVLSGLEDGSVTPPEFFDEVRRISSQGDRLTDRRIWDAWESFLKGIPHERLDLLWKLKKKYRLFLLSNTNFIHWFRAQNDYFLYDGRTVDDYFEKIFLSFEMHLQKPDSAIFQTVIDRADILPSETLFIDDSEANCRAAESVGLRAFCPNPAGSWPDLFEE